MVGGHTVPGAADAGVTSLEVPSLRVSVAGSGGVGRLNPDYLCHYTTAEGLQGTVTSNTLWATSAAHLNDSSEIEYGRELVYLALDWYLTEAVLEHKIRRKAPLVALNGDARQVLGTSDRAQGAVRCFYRTRHHDIAESQLREGAIDGGTCIGHVVSISNATGSAPQAPPENGSPRGPLTAAYWDSTAPRW